MLSHCGLLFLFLTCARTAENIYSYAVASASNDFTRFSLWPSVHNAATLLRIRRGAPTQTEPAGLSEGISAAAKPPDAGPTPSVPPPSKSSVVETNNDAEETKLVTPQTIQETEPKVTENKTVTTAEAPTTSKPPLNVTIVDKPKALDLNSPEVMKRGLIVFGGFGLMAVAYFIFYKRKNKNNDMNSSLGMNDANQFRYGVLQNEDTKDNLESTRVPLTMESEDEIDDDLEIFDLMQKKKSLSYVNLQQNDEDIVLSPREVDIEGDSLLLDIEDASSDTLINWSNNENKSIL